MRGREGKKLKLLDVALTVHLPGRIVESNLEQAAVCPIRKHMPRNNAIKPEGGWWKGRPLIKCTPSVEYHRVKRKSGNQSLPLARRSLTSDNSYRHVGI